MTLRQKIVLGFSIFLFLTVSLLTGYMLRSSNEVIRDSEKDMQKVLSESIINSLEDQLEMTELSVKSMVNNGRVQELFANRDRDGLIEYLTPVYDNVSDKFSQGQFHLPDSTSFLRLHNPEKYGDSLKDFRHTVNEVNTSKEIVRGIEEGVAGFGFRVVSPISYEGRHIGSFEYGSEFEEDFLNNLKESYKGDYFLYKFINEKDIELVSSTIGEDKILVSDRSDLDNIKRGETVYLMSDDKNSNISLIPFKSFDGQVIGIIKGVTSRTDIVNSNKTILKNSLMVSVAILVIAFLVFYFYLKQAFQPLNLLMENADEIAKGDFTNVIDVKNNDEIGMLASSFNNISASLKDMLGHIGMMADDVAATAEELSASSEEVSASTEDVTNNIIQVSEMSSEQVEVINTSRSGVNHMATSVEDLNSTMKLINQAMENVIDSTGEGIKSSNEVEEKILNLKDAAEKTSININRLNESSKEIENIVDTIQGIAEQTNLLALNAAIEAARAGEFGRGFSVVAEEVRTLAVQSAESSNQIDGLIKDIQKDIELAVRSMDESSREVEEGVVVVSDSNRKFIDIEKEIKGVVSQVDDITNLVQNIYGDIETVLIGFEDVVDKSNYTLDSAQAVTATSEEQASAMEEISSATVSLAQLASDLRDSISIFKY